MSGIDSNIPSFVPGSSGDLPEGELPPPTPETTPALIDALIEGELQDPDFLRLGASKTLNLPPGEISLLELAKIIATVTNKLKEALYEAEFLDTEISKKYRLMALDNAQGILDEYGNVEAKVDSWVNLLGNAGLNIDASLNAVNEAKDNLDNLLAQTSGADYAAVQEVNQYIDIYNDPDAFAEFANEEFGGNQQAAMDFINGKIDQYNNYLDSRPDLQAALDEYRNAVVRHNNLINKTNTDLEAINEQREENGLPALPKLKGTPVPKANINQYYHREPPSGDLPSPLSLPAGSTEIDRINQSGVGSYSPTPPVEGPGEVPHISYSEAFALLWLPGTLGTLAFMSSFNRILDLAESLRMTESLMYDSLGFNIILPGAYIQRAQQVFLDSIGALGGGLGLAAFAMGLHSRNIEIALSRAMLASIAMNARFPISGRLFARLQFTALELLQKSALLSPLPALRYIASAMGTLGASSPAVRVAISLAITTQVMGAVGAGLVRSLVNAQFNRMPFYVRTRTRVAMRNVVRAEAGLRRAIESGNPGRIRRSLARVGRTRRRLARITRLNARMGFLSIGGIASFTRAVAATMSLSMLSVAMAHFGRAIGLPGIVAQIFAHVSGVPTLDLLVAMSAGSRILDVLDNPFSVLALKQTLVDTLVFGRGFNSVAAGIMINSAVNNVILRGGIHSFSHLRAELMDEFQAVGFSWFQAHQLANETAALIRGDIGINFLNVAFGLNFDRSIIAASIVNNISGFDVGIAGAMMSNAITRSLMYGGFGSRVRLQNELTAQFQNLGLSWNDAYGMAGNMVNFIEAVGVVIPLNRYPGLSSVLLGNTLLSAVAFGSNIVRKELIDDFQARGLSFFQAEFLANQVTSLAARTFSTPGNLFELALEAAIERTGTSFETQREFRDSVYNELRGVGFSRNDALFLANSIASYGLDGGLISVFGVSAARLAAIEEVSVARLSNELGISGGAARAILDDARDRAIARGPYSHEDQFQGVLREEFHRAVANHTGRYDGHVIFDKVIAELRDPETILSLAALSEQISTTVLGILRPDLGAKVAQEVRDQILTALLGGTTVDEIEDTENRNPLSVVNQLDGALNELLKSEEEEDIKATLRKLIQLLQALLTPNAELGFLLQSLSDSPSTFIGSVLGSDQPKGEFLQIPA